MAVIILSVLKVVRSKFSFVVLCVSCVLSGQLLLPTEDFVAVILLRPGGSFHPPLHKPVRK